MKNFIRRLLSFLGIIFILLILFSILPKFLEERGFLKRKNKVAIIEIKGIIIKSEKILEELSKCEKNPSIKAVVLRLNTPGGAVGPTQEIYEGILNFKKRTKKPVVASMGSITASGGYYIACAADKIVANPGTITGSIGVLMEFPNYKVLFDKVGLKFITIKSGKYKDIGSFSREMTDEEKQILQNVVNDVYNQFLNAIINGRKLKREEVLPIADGRIFSGNQARKLKLVDFLGSLEDAINLAAKLAKIPGKPEVVKISKKKFSIFDLLEDILSKYLYNNQNYIYPRILYQLF